MDEQGLQNLLALGFTYEDLYKRGLLVLKPELAEQKQEQQKQDQQKQDQQKQEQQKQEQQKQDQQKQDQQKQDQQKQDQQKQDQQTQDAAAALTAVLESFKDDLIRAIQKTNLRDATRDENEKLSLDDAIAGLVKGDSSNG